MKQSGFILPATLLLITLLLLAITPVHSSLILALRSKSEISLAKQAQNKASNLALNSIFSLISSNTSLLKNRCIKQTAQISRAKIDRTFCASFHPAAIDILNKAVIDRSIAKISIPSIDYGILFKNSQSCVSNGAQISQGFSATLSPASARSEIYCELTTTQITDNKTFASNLRINSAIILNGSISVKGFLQSKLPIEIGAGSHKIVAAGDILIDSLNADNAAELSIISASGDVIINKVSGLLSLKVFAANNATIPNNAKMAVTGFQDLALNFLPIGFTQE